MTNSLSNILITGGDGQLAQALRLVLPHAKYFSRNEWDIQNLELTSQIISHYQPAFVINTAAYTNVDKAESERDFANAINHLAVQNLSIACQQNKSALIHLSTDYVFNGEKKNNYIETDSPHPINYYGESKLNGEQVILEYCEKALILRVSGVFSEYKHNFLKTMVRLAQEKNELRVVADQITCPTYAKDIADVIAKIISQSFHPGIYHFCSDSPTSWHQFCVAIINELKMISHIKTENVIAIKSADYITAAKRPSYSVLNCEKIIKTYDVRQPNWMIGIKEALKGLNIK